MSTRQTAQVALERAKDKTPEAEAGPRAYTPLGIENPLDAGLILPDPEGVLARFDPTDLADLLGVSRASVDPGTKDFGAVRVVDLRAERRCERSWKRDGTVRPRSDGGLLTDRDAEAVGVQ